MTVFDSFLDEILNLIESVSEGFPSYFYVYMYFISKNTSWVIPQVLTPLLTCLMDKGGILEKSTVACAEKLSIQPDPEVIKLFSCSIQLSMKF